MVRRPLLGLVVAALVMGGCGSEEPASVDVSVEPWELGRSMTERVFGPFHEFGDRPISAEAVEDGWQTVLLPDGNPVEAFNAVVDEAKSVGFETSRVGTTPCWRDWFFEEVQLGDASEGQTPVGEAPPAGSTAGSLRCEAIASRSDGSVEISLSAAGESVAGATASIVIRPSTAKGRQGDAVQQPVPDMPNASNELPDADYLERIGLGDAGGAELVGSAVIDLLDDATVDDGWCHSMLYRSSETPADAVRRAVEASTLGKTNVLTQTVTEHAVVDMPGAAFGETVAADGGTLVVSAVGTVAGSDLLVCRAPF